jgi:tetratricopeptide (TPR) repeat protein
MQAHSTVPLARPDVSERLLKLLLLTLVVAIAGFAAFYITDRGLTREAGLVDQAVRVGEAAVRDNPTSAGLRVALADVYTSKNRLDEAVTQYNAALEIDKDMLTAHRGLGLVYLERKQFGNAESEFQQIVDAVDDQQFANVNRGLEAVYYFLARAQVGQQKFDAAIDSLSRALAIDRTDSDAWELLGSAYLATARADDAVRALEAAVQFVPDSWDGYATLARAYDAAGNPTGVRYAQAMVLVGRKAYDGAISELRAVTQDEPRFVSAWIGLGFASEAAGRKADAEAAFARAAQLEPTNFNARMGLNRVSEGVR